MTQEALCRGRLHVTLSTTAAVSTNLGYETCIGDKLTLTKALADLVLVSCTPLILICVLDTGRLSAVAAPQEIRAIEDPESSSARATTDFQPGPLKETLLVIMRTGGREVECGAAALLVAVGGEELTGEASR